MGKNRNAPEEPKKQKTPPKSKMRAKLTPENTIGKGVLITSHMSEHEGETGVIIGWETCPYGVERGDFRFFPRVKLKNCKHGKESFLHKLFTHTIIQDFSDWDVEKNKAEFDRKVKIYDERDHTQDLISTEKLIEAIMKYGGVKADVIKHFKKTGGWLEKRINAENKIKVAFVDAAEGRIAMVETYLMKLMEGYKHPEDKVFQYKGEIIVHEGIKEYPPNVQGILGWLGAHAKHHGYGKELIQKSDIKTFEEIMRESMEKRQAAETEAEEDYSDSGE